MGHAPARPASSGDEPDEDELLRRAETDRDEAEGDAAADEHAVGAVVRQAQPVGDERRFLVRPRYDQFGMRLLVTGVPMVTYPLRRPEANGPVAAATGISIVGDAQRLPSADHSPRFTGHPWQRRRVKWGTTGSTCEGSGRSTRSCCTSPRESRSRRPTQRRQGVSTSTATRTRAPPRPSAHSSVSCPTRPTAPCSPTSPHEKCPGRTTRPRKVRSDGGLAAVGAEHRAAAPVGALRTCGPRSALAGPATGSRNGCGRSPCACGTRAHRRRRIGPQLPAPASLPSDLSVAVRSGADLDASRYGSIQNMVVPSLTSDTSPERYSLPSSLSAVTS